MADTAIVVIASFIAAAFGNGLGSIFTWFVGRPPLPFGIQVICVVATSAFTVFVYYHRFG